MAVKRGLPNRARSNARNFSHDQAQKRLNETVSAFNKQVENSLAVDAVEIELYQIQQLVGVPCSCTKTNIQPMATVGDDEPIAPVIPHVESRNDDIRIRFQDDDIFGEDMADRIFNDDVSIDVSGFDHTPIEEESTEDIFHDTVLGGSVDCGICYRCQLQPGFTVVGAQRSLFTSLNIEDMRGFTIDSTQSPHRLKKLVDQGYVSFMLTVPKYFSGVTVSIRNNHTVLNDRVEDAYGNQLTVESLRMYAGSQMEIRVRANEFTHATFLFDLGIPKIKANISGENIALDYDRLTTLSDMTLVLGPSLADINPGDIICVPKRNLVLKVRDKERKITADQRRLEWVVQTRVLQPTEPLKLIARGYKLF